jgi:hypothetical protein
MKVKIIASKPIDKGCSPIDHHIGKVFDTYIDKDGNLMAKYKYSDFILFEGEYEVIEE